jgi:hypothetical protein
MYLSWSRYLVLAFMCGVLLVSGSAIAYMHMGAEAAGTTLTVGTAICLVYLAVALPVWVLQKRSSRYGLAAACMMVMAAASMTLAAALPVFFETPVGSVKGNALALMLFLGIWRQGVLSKRHFAKQWRLLGRASLQKSINGSQIDLHRLVNELRLKDAPFYLLGKSAVLNIMVSALLLGSLLLGLNLRKVEPTIAMFLWGVPGLLLSAWIAHPVVMAIDQWKVIAEKEAEQGRCLVAVGEFW